MNYILLEETDSTNTYLTTHLSELESMTIVSAARQSRGRGQRGNFWEAEAGKNLTFSLLWRPEGFQAKDQFAISEAVSLAVVDTLRMYGIEARVKWPNDIYVEDNKIAGILIEHAVAGHHILHSVIGIGLNVNQRVFTSDAPNPVSMSQLNSSDHDLMEVLARIGVSLERRLQSLPADGMHAQYMSLLWRADGAFHRFMRHDGTEFNAAIAGVDADGMLSLVNEDGSTSSYAFKDVAFLL